MGTELLEIAIYLPVILAGGFVLALVVILLIVLMGALGAWIALQIGPPGDSSRQQP